MIHLFSTYQKRDNSLSFNLSSGIQNKILYKSRKDFQYNILYLISEEENFKLDSSYVEY